MEWEVGYGLETTNIILSGVPVLRQASFLHHAHIMGLRHGTQALHINDEDPEEGRQCDNTPGISFLDLSKDGDP